MLKYECVIKTAKDINGKILWRAIYVDNKKCLEDFDFDLNKALEVYAPNGVWKEVIFIDDDVFSYKDEWFPMYEDFIFLLDYTDISSGETILLNDGEHIVKDVWDDVRPAGFYEIWHWELIEDKWYAGKFKQYFETHDVVKFTIENSENVYVWQDWDYHQSFLYLNSLQYE